MHVLKKVGEGKNIHEEERERVVDIGQPNKKNGAYVNLFHRVIRVHNLQFHQSISFCYIILNEF